MASTVNSTVKKSSRLNTLKPGSMILEHVSQITPAGTSKEASSEITITDKISGTPKVQSVSFRPTGAASTAQVVGNVVQLTATGYKFITTASAVEAFEAVVTLYAERSE